MSDIGTWFKNLPVITRWWFGLSVAIPVLARFGLLPPYYLYLINERLFYGFQIWRPFTCVFYYPITPQTGFKYLMNLYFLYNYSLRLETGLFGGNTADYLFMLIFNWICCFIVAVLAPMYLLMDPLILTVVYLWCQINKDVIVTFWFGTQFKAMYLPWVLLIFRFVIEGSFMTDLIGILVGHLYYFLKFKYPSDFGGPSLINTPSILYSYFPVRRGASGFGQAPSRPHPGGDNGGRHNWGRGFSLGGN